MSIEYQEGLKQVREIKAGGGYQSFDAPRVYFGLGASKEVRSVTISLPRGEKTAEKVIQGPFPAGSFYELDFKQWD